MMNFGFLSLLLRISEVPISKICINEAMASSFHPCKDPTKLLEPAFSSATEIAGSNSNAPFSNETMDETCIPGGGFFYDLDDEAHILAHIYIRVI